MNLFKILDIFKFLIANAGNGSFQIRSNSTKNSKIIWFKSNKSQDFSILQENNRIFFKNNRTIIYFSSVELEDEEFYFSGYFSNNGRLNILNSFQLFIKGKYYSRLIKFSILNI